jgi:hypothetical protein
MSQILFHIQQICAYTHTVGMPKSTFTTALDECVLLAFTSLIGGKLQDMTPAFIENVMQKVTEPLCRAYLAYNEANSRDLPYAEYQKFISAVRACGHFVYNVNMQNCPLQTEKIYNARGTQPLPPTQPTPQPQPTQPTQAETRGNGNTIRALLAQVRALLDELEKASEPV